MKVANWCAWSQSVGSRFAFVPRYCLKSQYRLEKVIRRDPEKAPPPTLAEHDRALEPQKRAIDRIIRAVETLRIYKPGAVVVPGLVISAKRLYTHGGTSGHGLTPIHPWAMGSYELSATECAELAEFAKQLATARESEVIDAAVRRFGFAAERVRPDDKLVDLVISAEALFLGGDSGDPAQRGENRFRFALRGAYLLARDPAERRDLFGFLRNAYDARSAVVHGGSPKSDTLRYGDTRISLAEFAAKLESDIVRVCLKRAASLVRGKKQTLVDWDDLILGPRNPP